MFYYHFKISNDNCTTLHLAFCWHATHPSTPPTLSPRAQIFCAHSPKFVNQFNVNEPCRDGLAFGTPKNRLWKSGSVKLCKKIKADYMSIKLIQNMRLGETKPTTTTGSCFI